MAGVFHLDITDRTDNGRPSADDFSDMEDDDDEYVDVADVSFSFNF
jgi:hypothetical protein